MRAFSILLLFIPSVVMAQKADDILGYWLTDDAKAKIEIYKEGGKYNGKIVWLAEPTDEDGNPIVDIENPYKALQSRPLIGLNLVFGFEFDGEHWEAGEIYDPNEGETYSCRMKLKKGRLEVRGYIGMPMFGRTVIWTKTSL